MDIHATGMTRPPKGLVVGPAMLRDTVAWLAARLHHVSMDEWDIHCNRILAAARQLESPAREPLDVASFPKQQQARSREDGISSPGGPKTAWNDDRSNHALNCICVYCEADPVKQALLREVRIQQGVPAKSGGSHNGT